MYGAGAIVGPFVAAAMMSVAGDSGLFVYTALVHLLMAGYTLYRAARRDAVPEMQHVGFADAMAATHTKSRVYEAEVQNAAEAAD